MEELIEKKYSKWIKKENIVSLWQIEGKWEFDGRKIFDFKEFDLKFNLFFLFNQVLR